MPTLDYILDMLHRHHQRATYGAAGAVLGVPARFLMSGHPRDHRHSWIVRKSDGQPTGYAKAELHPALMDRSSVITSGEELTAWLQSPRQHECLRAPAGPSLLPALMISARFRTTVPSA